MAEQRFHLRRSGRTHDLTVTDVGISRRYVWTCDGVQVAARTSTDDRVTLTPKSQPGTGVETGDPERIRVRAGFAGVRRATLVVAGTEVDLVPEAGSPAARREERVRAHPRRHVALHTTAALAKVLIPVLGIGLVISWLPSIDLPSIPWPDIDLPSIQWPSVDLPSLPRPDWQLPSRVRWVLDKVKYVWPVLLAFGIAQHEVRRRRVQDERRSDEEAER